MSVEYQTAEQKEAEKKRSGYENYFLWMKWMFKFLISSK